MYQMRGIDKRFPGVHALKSVDLDLNDGEIVGLVGENGAGKSTLMKIIYGAYRPDGGEILLDGQKVSFASPRQAMAQGIGMVFQEQSLIPNLQVMENIFLGREHEFSTAGVLNRPKMAAAARRHLQKVKLDIDPMIRTDRLSFAQRQMVELAKVLTLEDQAPGKLIILLDEPTSVLNREEIDLLFDLVRDLRDRASFIFISHRMDEVMALSDRIYVMRDGAVVDVQEAATADVGDIQTKMVGHSVNTAYYREDRQTPYDADKVLVELDDVQLRGRPGFSMQLHAGEVLCLVGTEGAGREAILRAIFGMERPEGGHLAINGRPVTNLTPQVAVGEGIGYVPRERKTEGIIAGMNVHENMTLSQLPRFSHAGVLRPRAELAVARDWVRRLAIKVSSVNADCGNLSGGNQQKVVLAKWRSGGSRIMLLDHPTRGLDIGAKEDVYDMIREMSGTGTGVLLVADTLEEAIGLSHTIIVMKDGVAQHRFDCPPGAKPALSDLLRYMV